MSFVKDIYQDLIDKKLWLVAVALVALLIGVPMQLSKAGNSSVVGSVPAPTTSTDTGPELSLTRASTTGFARAPRVNRKEIDPFGNTDAEYKAFIKQVKKALDTTAAGTTGAVASTGDDGTTTSGGSTGTDTTTTTSTNSGSSGSSGSTTSTTPASTTPKMEKDDVISVVVTPEDDAQAQEIDDVRTLSPLPDADNPFLVYVGKTGDDTAQFIVASNAAPSGDGTCAPSVNDCSTLTLSVGQTETFVVTKTDNSTTPATTTTEKISVTLTDLSTKKVPVDDGTTDDTAVAARYQARARAIGAKVVKAALLDPAVGKALYKNHVVIGG